MGRQKVASLTFGFFLLELIAGIATSSSALVADSFHMLSDIAAIVIGIIALRLANRSPTPTNLTYGYRRAEILGAYANGAILLSLCLSIVIECVSRFIEGTRVRNPLVVLIVGSAGLLINVLGMFLFGGLHGHSHAHGEDHGHVESPHGHSFFGRRRHANSHGNGDCEGVHHEHGHGAHEHSHEHSFVHHEHGHGAYEHGHRAHEHGHGAHEHGHGVHEHSHEHSFCSDGHAHSSHECCTDDSHIRTRCAAPSASTSPDSELMTHDSESAPSNATQHSHHHRSTIIDDLARPSALAQALCRSALPRSAAATSTTGLNTRALFLHALSDAAGNIAVMVSSVVILVADGDWKYNVDTLMSLVIAALVINVSLPLLRRCGSLLLLGAGADMDVEGLARAISTVDHIEDIRGLRVWWLSETECVGSVEVVVRQGTRGVSPLVGRVKAIAAAFGVGTFVVETTIRKDA